MKLGTPIRDVAAFALCPESRAKGMRLLDATVDETARLARPLWVLFAGLIAGLSVALCLSTLGLFLMERTADESFLDCVYLIALLSTLGLFAAWRTWARIQHGGSLRLVRSPEGENAERLRQLLDELASQKLDARTVGGVVRSELFRSEWAVLLFSRKSDQRGWVRSPDGWRETREIFTSAPLPSASGAEIEPDEEAEPPLMNTDPARQWLVGGTAAEFDTGLDRFLRSGIPPDLTDWFRLVLTIGRRELRRGGQRGARAAAIKQIKLELKQRVGRDVGPNGGDSQHTIKQLLRGRRGGKDISGYFDRRGDRGCEQPTRESGIISDTLVPGATARD